MWQPVSKLPLGYTQEPARFNYYREMNDGALINVAAAAAILELLLKTWALMCSKCCFIINFLLYGIAANPAVMGELVIV